MTVRTLALATGMLLAAVPAAGQGCSQCAEQVGQTPARTQQAYRRGIIVMAAAGGSVFAAWLLAMRRFR